MSQAPVAPRSVGRRRSVCGPPWFSTTAAEQGPLCRFPSPSRRLPSRARAPACVLCDRPAPSMLRASSFTRYHTSWSFNLRDSNSWRVLAAVRCCSGQFACLVSVPARLTLPRNSAHLPIARRQPCTCIPIHWPGVFASTGPLAALGAHQCTVLAASILAPFTTGQAAACHWASWSPYPWRYDGGTYHRPASCLSRKTRDRWLQMPAIQSEAAVCASTNEAKIDL